MNGQISIEFLVSTMAFIAIIVLLVNSIKPLGKNEALNIIQGSEKANYCSLILNSTYSNKTEIRLENGCSKNDYKNSIIDLDRG